MMLSPGVSAGALIAPFAFLGPEWDAQLTEAFTSGRGEQMSVRGLLACRLVHRAGAPPSRRSWTTTSPRISSNAVAKEAGSGRLLWVATTDLDKEETVIWDLGAIAMRGGEPARKLFRDVLVASASIPGVFEPVLIHVQQGDGCTTKCMSMETHRHSLFIAPVAAYFALMDQQSPGRRTGVRVDQRTDH